MDLLNLGLVRKSLGVECSDSVLYEKEDVPNQSWTKYLFRIMDPKNPDSRLKLLQTYPVDDY